MDKNEARNIIEEILDTLINVGNGTTDEQLHECTNLLFKFRNKWFINIVDTKEEYKELLEDQKFLRALESAGVDNWEGYEYAQNIYEEW